MNINFPKINNKLAFFDYDRTLVAHKYSREYSEAIEGNYYANCLYMLTAMDEEYGNDRPLPCMQWYVNKLFEEGYGIYVLTHEIFNLRNELKQSRLKEFYPDIPMAYLTVDTPEHKIDMIRAVTVSENCELSDIIFVDDRSETVNMALAAGIDAKHLSDIVVLYENSHTFQQQGSVLALTRPTEEECDNDIRHDGKTFENISDSDLNEILEDCRLLAERNGRDGGMLL